MSQPQGEEQPQVVIRDKRRIDPTSGAVRAKQVRPRRVQCKGSR